MNSKRPVNLDLGSLKYPPMAIASILHRLSGLALFLLLPVMMYLLQLSLISQQSFEQLKSAELNAPIRWIIWLFSAALIYHLLAGVRHLLMDIGIGEQLGVGRKSAKAVIILAIILTIFLGLWIW